jgi:hypothetical protein
LPRGRLFLHSDAAWPLEGKCEDPRRFRPCSAAGRGGGRQSRWLGIRMQMYMHREGKSLTVQSFPTNPPPPSTLPLPLSSSFPTFLMTKLALISSPPLSSTLASCGERRSVLRKNTAAHVLGADGHRASILSLRASDEAAEGVADAEDKVGCEGWTLGAGGLTCGRGDEAQVHRNQSL